MNGVLCMAIGHPLEKSFVLWKTVKAPQPDVRCHFW